MRAIPTVSSWDCSVPNNRYVNDERICTAIAGMLAKIGVRINLSAIPRAQFFQKVDNFDDLMHLYGWGGATTDPGFTLTPVIHSPDGKGKGDFNRAAIATRRSMRSSTPWPARWIRRSGWR
jgi:peptide/nickel transport system substrate-binding protein